MAVLSWLDIIEGETLTFDANGYSMTRVCKIVGLEGNSYDMLYLANVHGDTPPYGKVHPRIPWARVIRKTWRSIGKGEAEGQIEYGSIQTGGQQQVDDPPIITVGASVQTKQTQRDVDGKQMFVRHEFVTTDDDGNITGSTGRTDKQVGEVEVQVPFVTLRFSARRNFSPAAQAKEYVGTMNQVPWQDGGLYTWLCTRIEGISRDGGETYEVDYEFAYNPETWWAVVVYIDPETNQIPPGIVVGEGLRYYQVQHSKNFGLLVA